MYKTLMAYIHLTVVDFFLFLIFHYLSTCEQTSQENVRVCVTDRRTDRQTDSGTCNYRAIVLCPIALL